MVCGRTGPPVQALAARTEQAIARAADEAFAAAGALRERRQALADAAALRARGAQRRLDALRRPAEADAATVSELLDADAELETLAAEAPIGAAGVIPEREAQEPSPRKSGSMR